MELQKQSFRIRLHFCEDSAAEEHSSNRLITGAELTGFSGLKKSKLKPKPSISICDVPMRWFIQLTLAAPLALLLIAPLLIATTGCNDAGSDPVAQSETSEGEHGHDHDGHDHDGHGHDHDEHGHDHDGEEHHEHAHDDDHKHAKTYDEAVGELSAMHKTIADAFADDKPDDAHGPLHDVGHLLDNTETLVKESDMDDATKKKLYSAIEQLFEAYGAVDDKMHDADEGKDYADVAEQIETAMSTLTAQSQPSKE